MAGDGGTGGRGGLKTNDGAYCESDCIMQYVGFFWSSRP